MNWWFSKNRQKQVFTYIKAKDIVKGSESKKIKLIKAKEYLIGIEAKKWKFKLIVNFITSLLSFKNLTSSLFGQRVQVINKY